METHSDTSTLAAGDIVAYYRVNHGSHCLVQQAAHNPWLARSTDQLRLFVRLLRGRQLKRPGRIDDSIAEHRALIEALPPCHPPPSGTGPRGRSIR